MWNASALTGYVIEANDGLLGTVSDCLFEDTDWVIQWIVVDMSNWLTGRSILVPRSALGSPIRIHIIFESN